MPYTVQLVAYLHGFPVLAVEALLSGKVDHRPILQPAHEQLANAVPYLHLPVPEFMCTHPFRRGPDDLKMFAKQAKSERVDERRDVRRVLILRTEDGEIEVARDFAGLEERPWTTSVCVCWYDHAADGIWGVLLIQRVEDMLYERTRGNLVPQGGVIVKDILYECNLKTKSSAMFQLSTGGSRTERARSSVDT